MTKDFFEFSHEVPGTKFTVRNFLSTAEASGRNVYVWYVSLPDVDEWLPLCLTGSLDPEAIEFAQKELELPYLPQMIAYSGLPWSVAGDPKEARAHFDAQNLWKSVMSLKELETLRACSFEDIRVLSNAENNALRTKGTGDFNF